MTTTPRAGNTRNQANTTDAAAAGGSNQQLDGQVIGLGDGGYMAVWTDLSRVFNPNGSAVVGQKYDALGQKVGAEVKLSEFLDGDHSATALTRTPSGGFATAYVDLFGGDSDIRVRVANANLTSFRSDLVDTGAAQTTNPSISAFANGSYVITYTIGTGDDTDIVGRLVSSAGFVGAQFTIHDETDNSGLSSVATLANGNFVVVLQDEFGGADTDIKFRIYDSVGTPVFPAAGNVASNVLGATGLGNEIQPDVAALKFGGFVVVWTDPDGGTEDIRASVYNDAGGALFAEIPVNTTTAGAQNEPSVVALDDGGFLVTWEDDNLQQVRGQRFDRSGNKVGAEYLVKANPVAQPTDNHDTALLYDGRIVDALSDLSSGDFDVTTQIWDPRNNPDDFSGEGMSDLLWRHDSGVVGSWHMDGAVVLSTQVLGDAPGDWHIQGTGDFNGDGKDDILLRHDSGLVGTWHMNGAAVLSTQVVGNAPNDWHIEGVGDFNGDGKDDLLWRHDSGLVGTWHMNGAVVLSTQVIADAPPDWHIEGVGDFNGDGRDDLLWRHDSGLVGTWHMNGAGLLSTQVIGNVPSDWHIEGVGDFNGDSKDDILLRNDSGLVGTWLMNGATIVSTHTFDGATNDWKVLGNEFDLI